MSIQRSDMMKALREFADNLEGADMPVEITVFEHYEQVKAPLFLGDAVAEARWHGRSIVIHVGDERWANHMTLAKRLSTP